MKMYCNWIIKKTSLPCKNFAKNGQKYCWIHKIIGEQKDQEGLKDDKKTDTNPKEQNKPKIQYCIVCSIPISEGETYCHLHCCKIKKCNLGIYKNGLCDFHFQAEWAFWYIYTSGPKPSSTKPSSTKPDWFKFSSINPEVEISLKYFGLPVNTTFQNIKSKYRELALKFHPDKPGGSHDKFNELSKHYNILTKHYSK